MDISNRAYPRSAFNTLLVAAIICATLSLTTSTQAVDVYTDPVGFITLTAVGTNGISGQAQSFLGLGLTQLPAQKGFVTSATTNEVVDSAASWANDQFNGGAGPHEIEILSGPNAGLIDAIVKTVSPNKIYTESDNATLLTGTPNYLIRPSWTLAKAFGPSNEAGLATADQIIVPNRANNTFPTYFYSTGGKAGVGWRSTTGGTTDKGNDPLYIDEGFVTRKSTGTNLLVKLVGAVKLGKTIIAIAGAGTNNFVGNVYASSAMTLSNSNLYTSNAATGLTTTDKVIIQTDASLGAAGYTTYFWSTGGKAGVGWRSTTGGTTEMGTTPLPLGANFVIQRGPGNGGFNWFAQAPYTP